MKRRLYFDNTKGVLITLVVFGHIIEPRIDASSVLKSCYIVIYSFHIPLFVFISGYFSRPEFQLKKTILKIVVPLLLFELAYRFFNFYLTGEPIISQPFKPSWVMWYLVSLLAWRLLLPVMRGPIHRWLIISILAGLLCGGCDWIGYDFSLSRTIVFLPYFLAGYYCREVNASFSRLYTYRNFFIPVIPVGLALCFIFASEIDVRWFYGSYSYLALHADFVRGSLYRGIIYAASLVTGIAILSMISESKTPFVVPGKNSLAIFLGHGFFIKIALALGFYR
jgi:fucose 4-O-acetylase-like acetyltransferase